MKNLVFITIMFVVSGAVQAQGFRVPPMAGEIVRSTGVGIGSSIPFGTFVDNPEQLNTFIAAGSDIASGLSPAARVLFNDGLEALPGAILSGTTILSPSVAIVPRAPLLNEPLPGLDM